MTQALHPDDAALPEAPSSRRKRGGWLSDFSVRSGRIHVRDTGADLRIGMVLIGEVLIWLGYHLIVRLRSWVMRAVRRHALVIYFAPHAPRPWYLVWAAMAWAGLRITTDPSAAQAVFAFEDLTWAGAMSPALLPAFNGGCHDVSKSRVAAVFEQVFGYPLAVDPRLWRGPAVEKSEMNGVHDGRVVDCPRPAVPGRHYQRLIDTGEDGFAHDLRTVCVGGRPVLVWRKRKPLSDRFSIHNLAVTLHRPEEVFSADELSLVSRFLAAMRADWAGLDILRDSADGRIYIVDVNKTDVGPIIALSLRDKLRSTARLARALEQMLRRNEPLAGAS